MRDIDAIDQNILCELEIDGRQSNIDLAQKVGLSPSACLRRVQELEREGIILGYRAILDRSFMGGGVTVYVTVGLDSHTKEDQAFFERAMAKAAQVRECHNVSGTVEYILRVEVSDLEAYKYFHTEVLGTVPHVRSITSHFCLSSPKDMRG